MRERAALIDAELDIRSAPGEGTRVQVLAPLPTVAMRPRLEMT
jgi:signal transduction histidine kinase